MSDESHGFDAVIPLNFDVWSDIKITPLEAALGWDVKRKIPHLGIVPQRNRRIAVLTVTVKDPRLKRTCAAKVR